MYVLKDTCEAAHVGTALYTFCHTQVRDMILRNIYVWVCQMDYLAPKHPHRCTDDLHHVPTAICTGLTFSDRLRNGYQKRKSMIYTHYVGKLNCYLRYGNPGFKFIVINLLNKSD